MKAWPYKQECRGHDPAKKESVALMKLALLARCAQNHCKGQCAVHRILIKIEKQTRNNTQAVAGVDSQIRSPESTDSEQHNEADKEAKRETRKPRKP